MPKPVSPRRTRVQIAALAVGAVFLLIAVVGLVAGVNTHYDHLTLAGHHFDSVMTDVGLAAPRDIETAGPRW